MKQSFHFRAFERAGAKKIKAHEALSIDINEALSIDIIANAIGAMKMTQ